jgi:hypothetical protein
LCNNYFDTQNNMEKHLTLNALNFAHKSDHLLCYLTTEPIEGAYRLRAKDTSFFIQHLDLPESTETIYTTFQEKTEEGIAVSLRTTKTTDEKDPCWSYAFLKAYYNASITRYFKESGCMVKNNFVKDIEVWVKGDSPTTSCTQYQVFQLRVQFGNISQDPELLVSFIDTSSVFTHSLASPLMQELSPDLFNWVIYDRQLYRYTNMPDEARRNLDQVFPCSNKKLKNALGIKADTPKKGNRYIHYWNEIESFRKSYLLTDRFSDVLSLKSPEWIEATPIHLQDEPGEANQMVFGNDKLHKDAHTGMKQFGPKELVPDRKVVFFFIARSKDKAMAMTINDYLLGKKPKFSGLSGYAKIGYSTEKNSSIYFENEEDPLPEILEQLQTKKFNEDTRYVSIYLSQFGKYDENEAHRAIYYRIKEELLFRNIISQTIEVGKAWGTKRPVENKQAVLDENICFSLNNIAIALVAKLGGIPWNLKHNDLNELVIGIGAFNTPGKGKKYLGSAFSFSNEGRFYGFDVFRSDQTAELAGSILLAVKRYCSEHESLQRLIIHFYKTLNHKELIPIEKGLASLNLSVPVIIVTINKTFSEDVLGFDLTQTHKMPHYGTYLAIARDQYLLYNNAFFSNTTYTGKGGYPFPLKIAIKRYVTTEDDSSMGPDITLDALLQQVCHFSLLYWKSVSRNFLPVTLKYPEMLARFIPHFIHPELPKTGKETLWFL